MSEFTKSRVTKIVTFRVTPEQYEILEKAALDLQAKRPQENIVVADVIREALGAYLAASSGGSNARPSASRQKVKGRSK